MIAAAALLVIAGAAVFAAWSIVSPSVSRTDAYRAGGMTSAASERVLLANAAVEGEPPAGWTPGPRLRQPGTLARLRYETFGADGAPLASWDVRALVPPAPDPAPPDRYGPRCPDECQAQIKRGSTFIVRSGDPGLAPEWVLRMPMNQRLDLGRRAFSTQDILDERPRQAALQGVEPSRIAVTLIDACAARVLAASVRHLEFAPNAIVPIPTGFRTYYWLQLDGCGTLTALPPPPEPPPPPAATPPPPPPEIRSVILRRAAGRGFNTLEVDESWFARRPKPIEFVLRDVCRYDAAADQWTRVTMPREAVTILISPRTDAGNTPRVVVPLPEDTALFYARWVEREEGERSARMQSLRDTLATSSAMLCNDIDLGPPPAGRVPACVPFDDRAQARFVIDPRAQCGR
jgi:hypothetical protein